MAKPIAVILTDTHKKDDNKETIVGVFREARSYAKEYNLKTIFHGGDIFDSRKAQTQDILNSFGRVLDEAADDGIEVAVIPGNHDKTDYTRTASFLDPFKGHSALRLYRIPTEILLTKTISITLAPFFADEEYLEAMDHIVDKGRYNVKKKVCLTHIGMDGAIMNNGIAVQSKITAAVFSDFDLTMIGHYHDASWYSNDIKYIGSSVQHNYGERPDKGLTVLYDDLSLKTEPLSAPKYIVYEVPVQDLTPKYIAELKKKKESTYDQLRVVITGPEDKVKAFDKQALLAVGVSAKTKEDKIVQEVLEEQVEAFTDQSLLEAFKAFCEKNNLDHATGLKYLNQVI